MTIRTTQINSYEKIILEHFRVHICTFRSYTSRTGTNLGKALNNILFLNEVLSLEMHSYSYDNVRVGDYMFTPDIVYAKGTPYKDEDEIHSTKQWIHELNDIILTHNKSVLKNLITVR